MRIWRILAVALIVMMLLSLGVGTLNAQTPTPTPGVTKVEGKATSVDLQAKKVTVTPTGRPAVVLIVTAGTDINVWGKQAATLEDVKVGSIAEAAYNSGTLEAIRIQVKRSEEPSLGTRQGFVGAVKSISGTSITLDTKQGTVVLMVDAKTQYWNPPKKDATLADVKAGDRVAVLAEKTDSTLVAKRVLIIPSEPVHQHIKGVVTKVSGTEITIQYDDKTVVGDTSPGVAKKIEVGEMVTATVIKAPGTDKVLIKDIEGHEKLLERLKDLSAKKTGKDKDDVDQMIDRNRQKQEQVLERVLAKAPEAAKSAIQKVLDKSREKGKSEARDKGSEGSDRTSTAPTKPK